MSRIKPKLLIVDDEPRILRSLNMVFRNRYQVFTANSGVQALDIVSKEKIDVILSDQRMPLMLGSELLRRVKQVSPHTMRLLLTGYSDLNAIINSINEGEVYRFISKPWNKDELVSTVDKAAEIAMHTSAAQRLVKPDPISKNVVRLNFMVLDSDTQMHLLVKEIVGNRVNVFHHNKLEDAFATIAREDIAILISDININGKDISDALNLLKQEAPKLMTIVVTSFRDTNKLVDMINHGQVYRFLPKPARKGLLVQSINSGLKNYFALTRRPELVERSTVEALNDERKKSVPATILNQLHKFRMRRQSAKVA